MSRDHPGDVNAFRPLLHELAARDTNIAVRRLAIVCLKNGSPNRDTLQLLEGITEADEADAELRKTARVVHAALRKKAARDEPLGRRDHGLALRLGRRWSTARDARELEIPHEVRVLSAHRTPDALEEYLADAESRGARVFVAAAGGAAHLAGVVASKTLRPVLGIPMGTALGGLDSLLSTVQMPAGIPVGTLAIGRAGAVNAALLAAAILALEDEAVAERLRAFREAQAAEDPRRAGPERS